MAEPACEGGPQSRTKGVLVINADDWGRDRPTTDRTLECIRCGSVSSVSAMAFMEDSERAAATARQHGIDAGLHLNFTTRFSAVGAASHLGEHQERLARHLRRHRFAQAVFHPGLRGSFEYVVWAQLEEFSRLYGGPPARIDGHHHMHLCANVILQNLMPFGTLVRRNFSFVAGEKGLANRLYRRVIDERLRTRHQLIDYFFALPPFEPPERHERIFSLAHEATVEVEAHPIDQAEYRFLTGGEIFRRIGDCPIARTFSVARRRQHLGSPS